MRFEEIDCPWEKHGSAASLLRCGDSTARGALPAEMCGQVRCVYLDPPFGTGKRFDRRVTGREEPLSLPGYMDRLARDEQLQLMHGLLRAAKALLAPDGGVCLHLDWHTSAYGRLLCDEVFGEDAFLNEVIWSYNSGGRSTRHFSRKHDTILLYGAGKGARFDVTRAATGETGGRRGHLKTELDEAGRPCRTIRSGGKTYRYYDDAPVIPTDVWSDISHLQQRDPERTGWPTQKPEKLLRRLLRPFCLPGELCADLCCGSGTTLAVAQAEGFRFLGVDQSPAACALARKRVLGSGFAAEIPCTAEGAALCGECEGETLRLTSYADGLESVEQVSVGSLCENGFIAQANWARTGKGEKAGAPLPWPQGEAPAVLVFDAYGNKHVYRVTEG